MSRMSQQVGFIHQFGHVVATAQSVPAIGEPGFVESCFQIAIEFNALSLL